MRRWLKQLLGCAVSASVIGACGASTQAAPRARGSEGASAETVETMPADAPVVPIGVRYEEASTEARCLRAELTFHVDDASVRRLVAQPDAALLVVGSAPNIDGAMLVMEARRTTEDDLLQIWQRLHELVSGERIGDDLQLTDVQLHAADGQVRATYSTSSEAPSYRFSAHIRRRHGAMCTIAMLEPSEQPSAFAQVFDESVQHDVPAGFYREPETPRAPGELGAVRAVLDVLRLLFQ